MPDCLLPVTEPHSLVQLSLGEVLLVRRIVHPHMTRSVVHVVVATAMISELEISLSYDFS